jgi:hypothetical protein
MKLIYSKNPGETPARVDVCGEPAGHSGDHVGKYAKMRLTPDTYGGSISHHGERIDYTGGMGPDPGSGPRADAAGF